MSTYLTNPHLIQLGQDNQNASSFDEIRIKSCPVIFSFRLFMKLLSAVMSKGGQKVKVEYDHDYAGSLMFKRARESHMNSFICTVVSNK
jgi:hypothetical protein